MVEIKNKEELEKVLAENPHDLVIVKFWAPWCGPCKTLTKTIEALAPELDNVKFVAVNIEDADEDFVSDSGIRNIPALKYFLKGENVDKTVGMINKEDLKKKVEEYV